LAASPRVEQFSRRWADSKRSATTVSTTLAGIVLAAPWRGASKSPSRPFVAEGSRHLDTVIGLILNSAASVAIPSEGWTRTRGRCGTQVRELPEPSTTTDSSGRVGTHSRTAGADAARSPSSYRQPCLSASGAAYDDCGKIATPWVATRVRGSRSRTLVPFERTYQLCCGCVVRSGDASLGELVDRFLVPFRAEVGSAIAVPTYLLA